MAIGFIRLLLPVSEDSSVHITISIRAAASAGPTPRHESQEGAEAPPYGLRRAPLAAGQTRRRASPATRPPRSIYRFPCLYYLQITQPVMTLAKEMIILAPPAILAPDVAEPDPGHDSYGAPARPGRHRGSTACPAESEFPGGSGAPRWHCSPCLIARAGSSG